MPFYVLLEIFSNKYWFRPPNFNQGLIDLRLNTIKNLFAALRAENDLIMNELDYKSTQRPSKLKLPNVLKPSKL